MVIFLEIEHSNESRHERGSVYGTSRELGSGIARPRVMFRTANASPEFGQTRQERSYPIIAHLEYRLREGPRVLGVGRGCTKTISTSRVSLESDTGLPVGVLIDLDVAWPARPLKIATVKLCIVGRTVAVRGNLTRVVILRHEFRRAWQRPRTNPPVVGINAEM